MNTKIKFLIIPAIICTLSLPAFSIHEHEKDEHNKLFEPIKIEDGTNLSVFDCVASAFQNSPKIRKQKYNLDIAKSNVGSARAVYFPVLSAGIGFYNENNSKSIYHDTHYRELPNVGIAINQMIYNFGKSTAFIKMEEFNKIAAEYEFMDSLCETLFDVKDKYYKLLRAKAFVEAASDDVKISEHFLKISLKKPDKLTAEVNFRESQINYLEAVNNYRNAKLDLTNEMYLDKDYNYTIQDTSTFTYDDDFDFLKKEPHIHEFSPVKFDFTMEEAHKLAYKNSPDLRILVATKKAMEQSLKYIKKTYLPSLTGTVGYNYGNIKSNNEERASNNSLQIGVNLTSEVNIKELYHGIKGADAQLKMADNEIDLFKQDLFFEIKRAFNNVNKSEKQIKIAQSQAEQAFYGLKLVIDEYKQGQVDYTALQDARKDFTSAEEAYITALYDYNIALIQVEMSMHMHIADIHHKSEHAMRYHANELLEHINKALACDEKETKKNRHKDLEEDL